MSSSATVPSIGHLRVVISKMICRGRWDVGGDAWGGHPTPSEGTLHPRAAPLTWNSPGLCTGTTPPRQPRLWCPATLHTVRCPAALRSVTRSSPQAATWRGDRCLGIHGAPQEPPSPSSHATLPWDGSTQQEGATLPAQPELNRSVHGPMGGEGVCSP